MLKKLKWFTILAMVGIVFSLVGCKQTTYIPVPVNSEVNLTPMKVMLSTTPELSNTTKTIIIEPKTVSDIDKVVWKQNGSDNPKELLEDAFANSATLVTGKKYSFDVTTNGTYYVAVKDKLGRQSGSKITVNEIDDIPTSISNFNSSLSDSNINLLWTDSIPNGNYDSPLNHVLISYKKDTETIFSTPQAITKGIQSYTISDFDSSVSYYDIRIQVVDELGNSSSSKARVYVDMSKKLQVGDVILKNGNILRYADRSTNDYFTEASNAVAVIYSVINDFPLGLGVKQSNTYLEWAKYDSVGYNTDFEGIKSEGKSSGDTDGSDNWDYICSIDPTGTTNPATNYPAFNFALNYAENNSLTGDYATGWYLPSIAELYGVYENRIIVNEVLSYLGESQIGSSSSYYWSSSQSPGSYVSALKLDFSGGCVYYYLKDSNYYVLVIRAF